MGGEKPSRLVWDHVPQAVKRKKNKLGRSVRIHINIREYLSSFPPLSDLSIINNELH